VEGIRRIDVLGCPFDAISFDATLRVVHQAVVERRRCRIVPANVDTAMQVRRGADLARVISGADLVIADGNFIVWAAALLGTPLHGRVSGTELTWQCAAVSAQTGRALALIGAAPGIAARTAQLMRQGFAGAQVHAIATPFPLDAAGSEQVVAQIRSLDAGIVLAALGAPRQERWIETYLEACGASVGIGIGSAFDILSGDKPRAPMWMQRLSLEWFYRMLLEPRRLGRRYLVDDMPFVFALLREVARRRVLARRPVP